MRYIDSSIGNAEQTVAWWMQQVAADAKCHFRCQSGYFTLGGASAILDSLKAWADQGLMVRLLLGSNQASTLASHVSFLAGRLGLPQPHVTLGIVSFGGSLFHPKVYHFLRDDGSEAAYVGSANFTGPGISGLNVEAGLIVDTRDGDDPQILRSIRDRIDTWFCDKEAGLSQIESLDDIQLLLDQGYLSLQAGTAPAEAGQDGEGSEDGNAGPKRPRRAPIVKLPNLDAKQLAGVNNFEPLDANGNGQETENRYRNLKYTEASFHYPQGTHLGHVLAVLWNFHKGRDETPFDDKYIRLNGSLGAGRIAGFRRQIKYKLLAAMELGLVEDVRLADDAATFLPDLTDTGRLLWQLLSEHVDVAQLEMGADAEQSTTLPQPPSYYNELIRNACAASVPLNQLYTKTMLAMPAVSQMQDFLGMFPDDRVTKDEIYRGYFADPSVIAFCDEVGIEPQTEESARHRCPFLLNILESLGRIRQEKSSVIRI